MVLEQERGFGKQKTPLKTKVNEDKSASPFQSSHQGEQEVEEPIEAEIPQVELQEPVAYENVGELIDAEAEVAEEEIHKLLSHASQKELLVPTQKDMKVREYIQNYRDKQEVSIARAFSLKPNYFINFEYSDGDNLDKSCVKYTSNGPSR